MIFIVFNSSASSLQDVFSGKAELIESLAAGNVEINYSYNNPDDLLLPFKDWINLDKSKFVDEEGTITGFFTEALSYIPYPDSIQDKSPTEKNLQIVNLLRAVSTQEGLTYISYRKGNKPAVLITKSYMVDRVGSRKKLEDPVLEILPTKIIDLVYQSDSSFFGNYYQYDYTIASDIIYIQVINKTNLAVFGIFPAITKEEYTAVVILQQLEEGVLVYSNAEIINRKPIISILGYKVHLPSAIARRWTAVHNWLFSQMETLK
ncbi:MAG: hypothetical protein ISR78_06890 [Spirochaetia bacterium]|nr:hypothetical protein [Spirochaetia bacterium]